MRKILTGLVLVLVVGIGIFAYLNKGSDDNPVATKQDKTVVADKPTTLDGCVEKAELDFRVYMITHTDGFRDENGTTIYNLPKDQHDIQAAKRADAVEDCYKRF